MVAIRPGVRNRHLVPSESAFRRPHASQPRGRSAFRHWRQPLLGWRGYLRPPLTGRAAAYGARPATTHSSQRGHEEAGVGQSWGSGAARAVPAPGWVEGVTSGRPAGPAPTGVEPLTGQGINSALATWTFAINFWAWNMIGPLSPTYTTAMSLTEYAGGAARRDADPGGFGRPDPGRRAVRTATADGPCSTIILAGVHRAGALRLFAGEIDSYPLLLVFGFFLGIAGTAFAIGIP